MIPTPKNKPVFMGIDPGYSSGAYAMINPWFEVLELDLLPKNPKRKTKVFDPHGFSELIRKNQLLINVVLIEKVHTMPKQGVTSSANFIGAYQSIKGVLISHKVSHFEITPNKWKRQFSLVGKEKKDSIEIAKNLFPSYADKIGKSPDKAEALLLAWYCVWCCYQWSETTKKEFGK